MLENPRYGQSKFRARPKTTEAKSHWLDSFKRANVVRFAMLSYTWSTENIKTE